MQENLKTELNSILELIKKQIGIELKTCEHFTGVKNFNNKNYFNVVLKEKISESKEYDLLERFARKYNLISIEPNGLKRVAIFF